MSFHLRVTYVGGPTALLEFAGLRLLTDPTFDPAQSEYPTPVYTLHKTAGPALPAGALGRIDAVLLSHDHHFDNLDRTGRAVCERAGRVLTTVDGAGRLGGRAVGLVPWQTSDLAAPGGRTLRVTATPARHGPAGGDRGPVIGFVLTRDDDPAAAVYVSGDTVWYEGVQAVADRFPGTRAALLFAGAARVAVAGPSHLTFTAEEVVTAARAFPVAVVVPLHFEGWQHFSESRADIERAVTVAGLTSRLRWPEPGGAIEVGA